MASDVVSTARRLNIPVIHVNELEKPLERYLNRVMDNQSKSGKGKAAENDRRSIENELIVDADKNTKGTFFF